MGLFAHHRRGLELALDHPSGGGDKITDFEGDEIACIYLGLERNGVLLLCLSTLRRQRLIAQMHFLKVQHFERHVRLDMLLQDRDRMTQDELRWLVLGRELDIDSLGQLATERVLDLLRGSLEAVGGAPVQVG